MVMSGCVKMVVVLAVVLKICTLVNLNIRNKKQSIPGGLRCISSPCRCLPRRHLCFGGDRTCQGGDRHIEPEVY